MSSKTAVVLQATALEAKQMFDFQFICNHVNNIPEAPDDQKKRRMTIFCDRKD